MVTLRNLVRITWMKANLGHQADQSVLAQLNKSSNPFEDEEYNWSYKRLYYPTD